jgi:hypothetical protein
MAMRYCSYEDQRFPEKEFKASAEHGWVHEVDPPHTVTGELIRPSSGGIPGGAMPAPSAPPKN